MKNLFFKNSKVASHKYATDNKWSLFKGVSPEDLVKNFNNIFLLYWECTPHKYNQNVPIILVSVNDDKTTKDIVDECRFKLNEGSVQMERITKKLELLN